MCTTINHESNKRASIFSWTWLGPHPFLPSPTLPFAYFPFLPPLSPSPSLPSLIPLLSTPNPASRSGERCKLSQWGLGANAFACILGCEIATGGEWLFSVVVKWNELNIMQASAWPYMASPIPSPNLVGSTIGRTYRPPKWSGSDPRSGWKSTPLLTNDCHWSALHVNTHSKVWNKTIIFLVVYDWILTCLRPSMLTIAIY